MSSSGPRPTAAHADGSSARDPAALAPGTRIADRYAVVRLVAVGGMAAVYEVDHVLTGRRHALKLLLGEPAKDETAVARFYQEARAATAVRNPHVVEVTDMGNDEDGTPFLVMELLAGEDVGMRLERDRKLGVREAVDVIGEVCEVLDEMHRAGIIHRDLKPENIFLARIGDRRDFVKLLDFGIAKLIQVADINRDRLTKTSRPVGTPEYMSPETMSGDRPPDHRVDIYALGVILYEVLSGVRPFESESFTQLVVKIATEEAPSLATLDPSLPKGLVAAVARMMARNPDDRPGDCREVARLLAPFGTTERFAWAGPFDPAPIAPVVPATPRRSKMPFVAIASTLAAAAVAVLLLRHRGGAPHVAAPSVRPVTAERAPATMAPPIAVAAPIAPTEASPVDASRAPSETVLDAGANSSHHAHHRAHHDDPSGFKLSPFRR